MHSGLEAKQKGHLTCTAGPLLFSAAVLLEERREPEDKTKDLKKERKE